MIKKRWWTLSMINIEFKAHDFRQANAGDTLLLPPNTYFNNVKSGKSSNSEKECTTGDKCTSWSSVSGGLTGAFFPFPHERDAKWPNYVAKRATLEAKTPVICPFDPPLRKPGIEKKMKKGWTKRKETPPQPQTIGVFTRSDSQLPATPKTLRLCVRVAVFPTTWMEHGINTLVPFTST